MIISHSLKFVFVKTNKTAVSSLECLLAKSLTEGGMITIGTVNEEEGNRVILLKDKKFHF